jgi:hypothetical protein
MKTSAITNMELERAFNSAQFEYEYMDSSVEEVAEKYGLPLHAVEYRVDNNTWSKKLVPTIKEASELEEFTKQVAASTQAQIIVAQSEFRPLALQLEKSIRAKALQIIDNLDPNHPRAANQLKTIEQVRRSLEETVPTPIQALIKGAGAQQGIDEDGLTINILQQA